MKNSKEFLLHDGVVMVREAKFGVGFSPQCTPMENCISITMRTATRDEIAEYQEQLRNRKEKHVST
jgi:hypothetical protein